MKTMRFAACVSILFMAAPAASRAALVIDFHQSGSDVIMSGSGNIDLSGLPGPQNGLGIIGSVDPFAANALFGSATGSFSISGYGGYSGPLSFGPGGVDDGIPGSNFMGDAFGLGNSVGLIFVPIGYVSGTSLSASLTFDGATLSSLGLTPGTYDYTSTSNGALVVVVNVESPAAVPEPSSVALCGIAGVVGLGVAGWRRRRRA
jgi:hypothetical protein